MDDSNITTMREALKEWLVDTAPKELIGDVLNEFDIITKD